MKNCFIAALAAVLILPGLSLAAVTQPVITSATVDMAAGSVRVEGFNFPAGAPLYMGRTGGGVDKLVVTGRSAKHIEATLKSTSSGTYIVAIVTGAETFYTSTVTIGAPPVAGGALAPLTEPLIGVPEADFTALGWSICYRDANGATNVPLSGILAACSKAKLMLACRPVGDSNFTLAAFAGRDDVTTNTGTDLVTTHRANGADWYYHPNHSWGFVASGDTVNKNTCDNTTGGKNDLRLCWHTGDFGNDPGTLSEGYRCGATITDETWERVILHHD